MNIFQRDLTGFGVDVREEEFAKEMLPHIQEAQRIIAKLNNTYHDAKEVREILEELMHKELDPSLWVLPPFYTDYGRNITLGKNVFINQGCTFMDRGGIFIGDDVYIAPKVNIITINHDINPYKRTTTYCKPVYIQDRVWIGIGATILAGVRVGENSIVGAGAVVTKDVPKNSIVAGNPARVIKKITKKMREGEQERLAKVEE